MTKHNFILLCLTLLLGVLSACKSDKVVLPPQPITVTTTQPASQTKAEEIEDQRLSRAAAAVAAARVANEANPAGLPKTVTEGELNVASKELPNPKEADALVALERVNAGLRGDLKTAQAGWAKAEKEAAVAAEKQRQAEEQAKLDRDRDAKVLQDRESSWKKTYDDLKKAADEAVMQAKLEAEAEMKRLIGYFFFGFAALCIVAGVACMTVLSGLGFVGPKVIAGCFISAGCLSGTGVLLIRAMSSPWIGRGIAISAVVAIVVVALAYANHKHDANSGNSQ